MKRKFAFAKQRYPLIVLILMFSTWAVLAQTDAPFSINTSPLPAPTSPVNDYVGVFDPAAKLQLESRLTEYKTKTGVEIGVAVVKTTGERPIFDYSLAVARGWGIGSKDLDNPSALLLIAVDDRKYFTQISKDLEDELPDGIVGNLQRQFLVPEFRKTNYAKGIADTIDAYIRTIDSKRTGGEAPPPAASTDRTGGSTGKSGGFSSIFCCLIVLGVLALIIWSKRSGGNDNDRMGGGFGGGGSALPWIIGSILMSGSGGSSSSGGWGGSSGGGGSDWGGFGGGGDFGGGGAGGDW